MPTQCVDFPDKITWLRLNFIIQFTNKLSGINMSFNRFYVISPLALVAVSACRSPYTRIQLLVVI